MDKANESKYILHVSDFHLSHNQAENKYAEHALGALTKALKEKGLRINYLIHTGDVINSSDLYMEVAQYIPEFKKYILSEQDRKQFNAKKFKSEASPNEIRHFNNDLQLTVEKRFNEAKRIIETLVSDLNIGFNNVVICCGNHDIMRPIVNEEYKFSCSALSTGAHCDEKRTHQIEYCCDHRFMARFKPFENFLNQLNVANSPSRQEKENNLICFELDDINVLVLNTNWVYPQKEKAESYHCVRCDKVISAIPSGDRNQKLNVIVAHKPIYEICETARLAYKRYRKTSFMAKLHEFADDNGIYLCGDKHTRSIVASSFHDIPHYIGGEPLTYTGGDGYKFEVEYNLIEIQGQHTGKERKIHLTSEDGIKWDCGFRPPDSLISNLYDLSKGHIIPKTFNFIVNSSAHYSWENLSQTILDWNASYVKEWIENLNKFYLSICKFRENGKTDVIWKAETNFFEFILTRLKMALENGGDNLLNIRGECNSGKSTFLGLLYIYLLHQYSLGKIEFIPVYFNLENQDILQKIKSGDSYYHAAKKIFESFVSDVKKIVKKERQPICFIIDGLDEQDCWSYSSEDSVGRVLLDILNEVEDSRYIMAFSQHHLPYFKNTMSFPKYSDTSDVLYFNPVNIQEEGSQDTRFVTFVDTFFKIKNDMKNSNDPNDNGADADGNIEEAVFSARSEKTDIKVKNNLLNVFNLRKNKSSQLRNLRKNRAISSDLKKKSIENLENFQCKNIRKFRCLTISPGFMYDNCDFISSPQNTKASVDEVYKYYIDRLYDICMDNLGYGFVHYAPAMAFMFSYKGYTYEKFRNLPKEGRWEKQILEFYDKIYDTFLFIKKNPCAREYLVALHYNRELRYYAENLNEKIEVNSILNEFISRNTAVMIRMLWDDYNKMFIVFERLIERSDLSNCALSMLIYILAHQKMVYEPIRDKLQKKLLSKSDELLKIQNSGYANEVGKSENSNENQWEIFGNNVQRLDKFMNFTLKHTIETFRYMDSSNSLQLVSAIRSDENFNLYNRQYQLLYYGDLTIRGEDKKRALNPGQDTVNKGFDFHNCFNYLYVKLSADEQYALREYDLYTICDLVISRLKQSENVSSGIDTFFKRKRFKEKSDKVIERTINLLNHYLNEYEHNLNKSNENKQSAIRFHTLGKVKSQRNSKHTSAQSDAISYFYESRDLLIQILQSRQGPKNSSL